MRGTEPFCAKVTLHSKLNLPNVEHSTESRYVKLRTYRPEIDGLRAIAVLSVIAYHFEMGLRGGFFGVDVFFVISGYLITSLILAELGQRRFSFLGFYARRARRILPALLTMLVATMIAGWFLLLPNELQSLGEQAGLASVGLSNFLFYSIVDYFHPDATLKPLLHTWSLGVEEQFYLLWPALVVVTWKLSRGSRAAVLALIALIGAGSYALALSQSVAHPDEAFYLLHTRAFELALGGLGCLLPVLRRRWLVELVPAVGLVAIAVSVFLLNRSLPLPAMSLLPCLGALLVIWPVEQASLVNRGLAMRPLVGIGLISYSLYLWHYPVIALFLHYAQWQSPDVAEIALLLVATVGLSILSWRFVEQPFRRRPLHPWRMALVGVGAIAISFGFGLALYTNKGFPNRLPEAERAIAMASVAKPAKRARDCEVALIVGTGRDRNCLHLASDRPNVLLAGDSHARHFGRALGEMFPNVNFVVAVQVNCRPVLASADMDRSLGRETCFEATERLFEDVVPVFGFDAIILSARWHNGNAHRIAETVDYLQRFTPRVIVFGQTIEYAVDLPVLMAADTLLRRQIPIEELTRYDAMRAVDDAVLDQVAGRAGEFYSPLDAICRAGASSCRTLAPSGAVMANDYGHLTLDGARYVLEQFKAAGLAFWSD
ncbi:acyltransferase family protein [Devosia sp.]|uniref:acyltransferase family protein n=1 Tax=Devosia sp. TaxID=1871048 RepID=UPI003A939A07